MNLEFKKNRERFEVNVSEGNKKDSKSVYHNFIDRDPNKLAQVLIDLYLYGFKIEKAIQIFQEKLGKKDWLGL